MVDMDTPARSQFLRGWKLTPLALATVAALSACSATSSAAPAATGSAPAPAASSSASPAGSTPAATTSPAAAGPVVITIKSFTYASPASVAPGAMVTVKNEDAQGHTVTGDTAGQFDAKVDPKGSVSFAAPTKPGSYPFHCTYHGNMHGVLVVK